MYYLQVIHGEIDRQLNLSAEKILQQLRIQKGFILPQIHHHHHQLTF